MEEMVIHEGGGKAHKLNYDMTLVPTNALICLAKVLTDEMPSHGRDNWKKLTLNEQIRHAYSHLMEFMALEGWPSHTRAEMDYHLVRLLARAMFAYSKFLTNTECSCCDTMRQMPEPSQDNNE